MDMLTSPVVCRWSGCNLYFADSEELLIHCTNDHIGRKSTNNLCLDCHWEGCDVKTTKRDHITSHMKVHIAHKPHACLRCGKTFKRPQDLKKHEKLHMDGQEAQLQDNIIFQPYTIPSSEYSSSNGFDLKVSQRDLSPQSASSEILATTPPNRKSSQTPQMNQYFNQLYNGIIEKQLVPQYNNEMSSFLNTLATSEDYSQSLQTVVNKDMDIDYFNSFMGQLQNDITGNLGCFQNNPNSFVPFQQNMPNMIPCDQGFDPAFPANGNSYLPHNNQAYFNNNMNLCQQNYQQQPMNLYQDMNYSDGMSSQPNMPYMNMANQYVSMEAPQVNYNMYPQYTSMTVTPQRCEASEFLDEDKDDTSVNKAVKDDSASKETNTEAVDISPEDNSVSSEVESLAQTLKNLELYSKEDQGKVITPKEADERLQHAALINDLVAKVNSIYQALNPLPKPSPKKENFLSDLIEKKVQTHVTLTSGSYPSLDDL